MDNQSTLPLIADQTHEASEDEVEAAIPATTLSPPEQFDYGSVPAEIVDEMRAKVLKVRAHVATAEGAQILVGRELLAIKGRIGYGHFQKWVTVECQLSLRSAQNAMQAATAVMKNANLAYLPQAGLIALTARTAPEPIVTRITKRIDDGEQPTASEIIREIAGERTRLDTERTKYDAQRRVKRKKPEVKSRANAEAAIAEKREKRMKATASAVDLLTGSLGDRHGEFLELLSVIDDWELGQAVRAWAQGRRIPGETGAAVISAPVLNVAAVEIVPDDDRSPLPNVVPVMVAGAQITAAPPTGKDIGL